MVFSKRLKSLRTLSHATQAQIAAFLNVTVRQYQLYEAGKSYPSFQGLLALANYFCVSLDFLTGRDDEIGAKDDAIDYFAIPTACDRMSIDMIRLKIGGRLKKLRINTNYTQAELARYMGVAQNTYANYENGNRSIPDDIKIKLADFFGVSLDFLLGRSDEPKPQKYLLKKEND